MKIIDPVNSDCIYIGLIGLGTVGTGVVRILNERAEILAQRIGKPIRIKKIAVKNLRKKRGVKLPKNVLTTKVKEILTDPEISIVVEVMGGVEHACDLILEAAKRGKHIVTANKALLAERGPEVLAACSKYGVDIGFEAAVCGGVPIIRTMREGLSGDEIEFLMGIVNGTSNYIMTRMNRAGISFKAALKEAQNFGYAEADPTMDIDGTDAAHKLAILASIAYGARVDYRSISPVGIQDLTPVDFDMANKLGYRIRLLALLEREGDQIIARVHPTMIPKTYLLSAVEGPHNAVYIRGKAVGPLMLYGQGAGQGPTANSVVADLVEISRSILTDVRRRVHMYSYRDETLLKAKIMPLGDVKAKHYLRMTVIDRPGVIAKISQILGKQKIGIHSAILAGNLQGERVQMVFLLHEAAHKNVLKAVAKIDQLDVVFHKTLVIFIEDRQVRSGS